MHARKFEFERSFIFFTIGTSMSMRLCVEKYNENSSIINMSFYLIEVKNFATLRQVTTDYGAADRADDRLMQHKVHLPW